MPELLSQAIVTGLAVGMIYGLVAVGMLIVYSVSSAINLAHGDIITVAMYLSVVLIGAELAPYWVVLIACPALGLIIGAVVELLGNRPLARRRLDGEHGTLLTLFISTLALSFVLQGALVLLFPTQGLSTPSSQSWTVYSFGDLRIPASELLLLGVGIASAFLVVVFFRITAAGRAMRAIADNHDAAALMGINVRRITILGWTLSGLLAGLAGGLLGPGFLVTPFSGGQYLFIAFAAAVIGGFGSIEGALVGGLMLGLGQALFSAYVGSGWSSVVPFAMVILLLLVRPRGLFGRSLRSV
jgi:branched-chain amino acid transport system permease protein